MSDRKCPYGESVYEQGMFACRNCGEDLNTHAIASTPPADDVREALERTLADMLWVSDYTPGVGDQGYYVTDPRTATSVILDNFDVEAKHRMIFVEGEIEVCAGCVNSLGYNVAWDQAEH